MKTHKLRIINAKGDTLVEFAPPSVKTKEAEESRQEAEKIFNQIMKEGRRSVLVTEGPREGERLRKFDPTVKEAIAIPQIVGG